MVESRMKLFLCHNILVTSVVCRYIFVHHSSWLMHTKSEMPQTSDLICISMGATYCTFVPTLISLINVEVGINVEGVQKLPNH